MVTDYQSKSERKQARLAVIQTKAKAEIDESKSGEIDGRCDVSNSGSSV